MTAIAGPARGSLSGMKGPLTIRMKAATMSAFADRITRFTDKPVVDMTGMAGTHDFNVTFAPEESDSAPSLFTALQEQMGLKLEARKATVTTVVIDKADKLPAEN
ncbi:MAG TPA: TIGR03435 family protein [Bryobacteraceae bacterium]|nr:TIGR03435 family protein [Bryobacteraceae bacterium]